MKICVSALSGSLDAQVNTRFGRSQYFVFVDSETMEFEVISNPAFEATGGAGVLAAQTVANRGNGVVITGNVGPNAFVVLSTAGIRIMTGATGTVKEAVEQYARGELKEMRGPTVGGHHGTRKGWGRT